MLVPRADAPAGVSLLFFAAIGLGFLLLEVALIQRFVLFLGFPTYALSVVLFALLAVHRASARCSRRALREPRRGADRAPSPAACVLIAAARSGSSRCCAR